MARQMVLHNAQVACRTDLGYVASGLIRVPCLGNRVFWVTSRGRAVQLQFVVFEDGSIQSGGDNIFPQGLNPFSTVEVLALDGVPIQVVDGKIVMSDEKLTE